MPLSTLDHPADVTFIAWAMAFCRRRPAPLDLGAMAIPMIHPLSRSYPDQPSIIEDARCRIVGGIEIGSIDNHSAAL
jgi:hypothetical protein